MSGFDNQTMFANNVDFTGNINVSPTVTTNSQLLIGSTIAPNIRVGNLISPLGTVTLGYSSPNITIDVTGGTVAMEKITVDANTAPGTNPVVPTVGGFITMTGNQVASGVVGAHVIRTDSLAANSLTIEIQRSTSAASSTVADNGVAHFDSAQFLVDANAFVTTTKFNALGAANLGITNTAGTTFTVNAANGTALSATNPAYVTLQSLANPGQLITYTVTANQSFTQSNISNNGFNIVKTVDHANTIPFFLYAVSNAQNGENAIAFMVSTYPNTTISPVAGKIAKTGSAVANSQGSFFCLSNVTVADYASSPCLCVGSFRMTYATSGTNWTITTFDRGDGIGEFQLDRTFTASISQYGAATSSYFYANGGTAPQFTTNNFGYFVGRNNMMTASCGFVNCSVAGVGSVNLWLASPYSLTFGQNGAGVFINAAPVDYVLSHSVQGPGPNNEIVSYYSGGGSSGVLFNNSVTISASIQLGYYFTSFMTFS